MRIKGFRNICSIKLYILIQHIVVLSYKKVLHAQTPREDWVMANLITEIEIKKFSGMKTVLLPAGTIITPAAKDWVNEHHLKIEYEGQINKAATTIPMNSMDHQTLLKQVITAVIKNLQRKGTPIRQEEIIPIIIKCLERLGCQVK